MRETKSNSQIINELVDRFDTIPDAPLSQYTSFQVGGRTPALIQCRTLNELIETIRYLNQKQQSFLVVGQGTNLLVSDKGVKQIIVRFCNEEASSIKQTENIITVGGEMLLDKLVIRSLELGLGDLGYLSGIPGTVGGAIVGNAGAFGEQIGDVLQRAELLSYDGIRRWVSHDELCFAYRSSVLKESREILLRAELTVTEVDKVEALVDKMMNNKVCRKLIHADGNEFEVPGVAKLSGNYWKGKADIVNHSEKLIVDLKTTADLDKFQWSAKKYNYDSQAFVYKNLFGYNMIFIAIDKNTGQIGIYDCSDNFYKTGFEKVEKASEIYDLFFNNKDFDPSNYFINKTL